MSERWEEPLLRVDAAQWRWIAVAVVAAGLAFRLFLFTGPSLGDDFAYLEHAEDWASGVFDPGSLDYVYGLRYGVTVPTAAAIRLLGLSSWAVALPALLASVTGMVIALRLGTSLGGPIVGVVAAGLVAFTPVTALSATMVLPESFLDVALWSVLLLAFRAKERRSLGLWALAGVVAGASYLVRSYGIALAGLGALPLLFGRSAGGSRQPLAAWFAYIAASAIPPLAEVVYHGLRTGDPLLTAHLQAAVYADLGNLNNSLLFYPKMLAHPDWAFGVFPWLVASGCFVAVRDEPRSRLAILWLGLWFAFLQFTPMSWSPFVLIHKEPRYLSILVLPAGLILGFAARAIFVSRPSRIAFRAASLAVVVVAFGVAIEKGRVTQQQVLAHVRKYRDVAALIQRDHPESVVFPHERWPLRVNYFAGYKDGFRAFAPPRGPQRFRVASLGDTARRGEWVVVDSSFFGREGDWKLDHSPVPDWLESPPAGWPVRARVGDVRIVVVNGASPDSSRR